MRPLTFFAFLVVAVAIPATGCGCKKGASDCPSGRGEGTAPRNVEGRDKTAKVPPADRPAQGQGNPVPAAEKQAGILTAGSYDDNLYPGPYRRFLSNIAQNALVGDLPVRLRGRRVEVTVKDVDGRPAGNLRVRVNAADQRSVELLTRTDGRVVFLDSWDGLAKGDEVTVTVTPGGGEPPLTQKARWADGRCAVRLPNVKAARPRQLDLAIVLDTTGSMGKQIRYLQAEIKNIVAAVNRRFSQEFDQRYALVLYRDTTDKTTTYLTRTFDFTRDLNEFHKNLAAQNADGGGDLPEAVQEGFAEATKLAWRQGNTVRVLFWVADAPPHAEHALQTLELIDRLRKQGVVIYPVAAICEEEKETQATEFFMRTAALLTGTQYVFLTEDSGVGGKPGAEPQIPFYRVEHLNKLMIRLIASELAGERIEPAPADILRTVGDKKWLGAQQ